MISRLTRRASIPTNPGISAAPNPAAAICMPMVFAAKRTPTRWLVPDTSAGKMGAMANPINATASRLAQSVGFHHNRTAPPAKLQPGWSSQ